MFFTPNLIVFFVLATLSVASALGMLFSRNAVHSALYLVLNFAVGAVFFLTLNAPFISMVQITVYAGAIMVLFLFVIMLLGAEMLRQPPTALPWQGSAALLLGLLFAGGVIGFAFLAWRGVTPEAFSVQAAQEFGSPQHVGQELFSRYLLPFELTSLLLLVGMIGAVVLTRDEKKKTPNPQLQTPKA